MYALTIYPILGIIVIPLLIIKITVMTVMTVYVSSHKTDIFIIIITRTDNCNVSLIPDFIYVYHFPYQSKQ